MSEKMKILALEPYYGGSHKIFLDRLASDSMHNWTKMTLPPWKWKWRMMHSALTFAEQLNEHPSSLSELRRTGRTSNIEHRTSNESENQKINKSPDPHIIFCTDMLNLAEFKGLMPARFADIPTIAYFHENQLTYPTHYEKRKDRYFGWINITTALAADSVWFNSEYHMDSFLDEVVARIKKAPDCRPANLADKIRSKSIIIPQGIKCMEHRALRPCSGQAESMGKEIKKYRDPRPEARDPENTPNTLIKELKKSKTPGTPSTSLASGPLSILWAARWEFDKNPDDFFDALRIVRDKGIDFRLSVIGGKPEDENPVFMKAEKEFAEHIDHWGFLESQKEYENVLIESDVVVSTAIHEFFGISIAEAVAAGAFPLIPKRLAYPEVLKENQDDIGKESFFFDGTPANLAEKIAKLADIKEKKSSIWEGDEQRGIRKVSRFYWENVIPEVDKQLIKLTTETTEKH